MRGAVYREIRRKFLHSAQLHNPGQSCFEVWPVTSV